MNDTLHVIYMYMYMFVCLIFFMFYVIFIFFYFKDLSVTGKVQTMSKGYMNSLTFHQKRIICSTREVRTRGGGGGRGGGCGIKKVIMLIVLSVDEW